MIDFTVFKNGIPPNTLEGAIRDLDFRLNCLDDLIMMNGFFPLDVLKGLFNSILNVLRNITLSIVRFNKDITQSEFMLFANANKAKVTAVANLGYDNIKNMEIDVPTGLKSNYIKLVSDITQTYNIISMLETSNNATRLFKALVSQGNEKDISFVLTASVQRSVDNKTKESSKLVTTHFKKSIMNRVVYKQAFPQPEDFKNTIDELKSLEYRLFDVSKNYNNMKTCESLCDRLILDLSKENDINISNKDIKILGEYVRNMAQLFENYALVISAHQVAEHNLILVIKEIGHRFNIF